MSLFVNGVGIGAVAAIAHSVVVVSSTVDRLQKQIALLDELFEQAPQAVALMSRDYRIVRVNREFTQLFGYGREEVIGRSLGEMIIPEELQHEVQQLAD